MLDNGPMQYSLIDWIDYLQFSFHPRAMKMCTSVHEPVPVLCARMAGTEAKNNEEIVSVVNMIANYEIKECDVATVRNFSKETKRSVREKGR